MKSIMTSRFIAFATASLLALPAFTLDCANNSASGQAPAEEQQVIVKETTIIYHNDLLTPPHIPDYMVFAGDTVWMNRADIRERLDRELLAFSYMHSNSMLMIKRANRYFPQVEPILESEGIPDDLKYLMAIESNCDPSAVSTAGAAGLWQFMKGTAQDYGLVVDGEVDERYNIEKETRAACKYLRKSYQNYGDWMSVAASYNAGPRSVSERLEEQKQTSALDVWLVNETSRYMFRVLVAKMFFENPTAFGFTFNESDLYPYIPAKKYVTVSGPVTDLVEFAAQHGVSYAQLKRANLWIRGKKIENKAKNTYKIAIPDIEKEKYDPSKTKAHNEAWVRKPDDYFQE